MIRNFIPKFRREAYDALRAFNLELVRLPELVSNPTIGQMRMQFWRDAVNDTFAGKPPKGQPIMILLHKALQDLAEQFPGPGQASPNSIKFWMLRVISMREKYMDNRPFTDLAALEEYAENTYSTLMYATLAALPIQSMHVDHLASHIGKACGIVAVLRGIPFLAAPSPPVKSPSGTDVVGGGRNPVLLLPLDVMAEAGLREEDVYRQGPQAEGFQDAIFKVATRANDHLITAREMLKKLQAGEDPGHEYEHQGEAEHNHIMEEGDSTKRDINRGFGVLLEGVPASNYLARLEKTNFDPFAVRSGGWRLPWNVWRAMKTQKL